jgi:beta-glucosidase
MSICFPQVLCWLSYLFLCSRAGYNAINGTPACADVELFNDMVRAQWGFTGYVVSDCDAIANIYTTHHYTNTTTQAAADGVNAGECRCQWGV